MSDVEPVMEIDGSAEETSGQQSRRVDGGPAMELEEWRWWLGSGEQCLHGVAKEFEVEGAAASALVEQMVIRDLRAAKLNRRRRSAVTWNWSQRVRSGQ